MTGPLYSTSNSECGPQPRLEDPRVEAIAGTILESFNKHYRIFREITLGARERFITADWVGEKQASQERITLYTKRVTEACDALRERVELDDIEPELWARVKQFYINLLYEHKQPELAETFYNSVFTWLFDRRYYNNANIFVRPAISLEYLVGSKQAYLSYYPMRDGLEAVLRQALLSFDIGLPFEDLERDIARLVDRFNHEIELNPAYGACELQIVTSLFYRNKAAYIVGRVRNRSQLCPFVIPLLHGDEGAVYVDALVHRYADITNLFSYARAYFMVDTEVPAHIVRFLNQIMPGKTRADLYSAIGLQKQGKSEFYRNFLHRLAYSSDKLEIARGTKGMVMTVFTLPSYPFVLKCINDRFAPPKNVTRQHVEEKYLQVKMHDRVGRMADTLEFSYVALPLERITDELLVELKDKISNSLEFDGDHLIIKHLYIERRMEPLNIYLENASGEQLEDAILGYGNAIKELAAANIFPGDLLLKNFGVTSFGRVIFYDYDEIELLTDCNFRRIPPPRFPEDEMAAEPWYSIGPRDVFPEEFLTFVFTDARHRKIFLKHHADLLDAEYWQTIQQDIRENRFRDVFPYAQSTRFQTIYDDSQTTSTMEGN